MRAVLRILLLLLALLSGAMAAPAATWRPVGPDGGDVRSLAADPRDPDRILLGTSSGQLFVSRDGGENWARMARLGDQDQYVLDHIVFDPEHPGTIWVAAWDVTGADGGDLFCSTDDGRTWSAVPGMHGKSIRAFVLTPGRSEVLVAGALDGVFRSADGGANWERISPEGDAEIKNIESLAIDPRNPDVIYVGTWHLPWKTIDGGHTWISIRKGWIDDSDVFSIVLEPRNPDILYASACTGVYRSDNAAALFRKLKGIPTSARRTRKLQLHPSDPNILYAGTTEGLYRSIDGGKSWKLISAPGVIVNDILVDERRPGRVLVASDRGGVLRSENGGRTFYASNRGFAHRQVAALLVDRGDSSVIYAGVVNDKEFGGVFMTRNAGEQWKQISDGLGGRDVFTLRQTLDGVLLAGTNRGLFYFDARARKWQALTWSEAPRPGRGARQGLATRAVVVQRGEVSVYSPLENARIADLEMFGEHWYAATSLGLFSSRDQGRTWQGGLVLNHQNFIAVHAAEGVLAALTSRWLALSGDSGATWYAANLPPYMTELYGVTTDGKSRLWLAAREGAFRSDDGGQSWEHVMAGLPARQVTAIVFDPDGKRLLATAGTNCFESADDGRSWRPTGESLWRMRGVSLGGGRIFASSTFDGVLAQGEDSSDTTAVVSSADTN